MKKLFTLLAIGFAMIAVTGCSPSFDIAPGTYGYTLDPVTEMPVLQEVGLYPEAAGDVVFYTLDGSTPALWDVENATPAQMDALMNLEGSIPYLDLSDATDPPNPLADFTQYTAVGTIYFMKFAAMVQCMVECEGNGPCMGYCADTLEPTEDDKTTTIKAIELNPTLALLNIPPEVTSGEFTIDMTIWNGDFIAATNAGLLGFVGLFTEGGFETIDGDFTITGVAMSALGVAITLNPNPTPDTGIFCTINGDLTVTGNTGFASSEFDLSLYVTTDDPPNPYWTVVGDTTICGNSEGDCP